LNEHFTIAVLLFTDDTYRDHGADSRQSSSKRPRDGLTLAPEWTSVVCNLAGSFESRLVLDLLSAPAARRRFSRRHPATRQFRRDLRPLSRQ
jgi:hypothetical protein